MTVAAEPQRRGDFGYFTEIPTRWSDNDMFGHLNNVIYNRFFETVVVSFYRERTPVDFGRDTIVPYVAEILCRFRKPLSFPETVSGALRVEQIGTSSVRFGLALFRQGDDEASAYGHWVHVFVNREIEQPVPIPENARVALEAYL